MSRKEKEWYEPIFVIYLVIRNGVWEEYDRTQSLKYAVWLFHHLLQANPLMDFVLEEYDAYHSEDAPDNIQLQQTQEYKNRPFKKEEYVRLLSENNESPLAGLV